MYEEIWLLPTYSNDVSASGGQVELVLSGAYMMN